MLATDFEETKLFDVAGIQEAHRGVDDQILEETLRRPEQTNGTEESEDEPKPTDEDPKSAVQSLAFGHDLDDPSEFFREAYGIYAENYPVEDVHIEVSGSWKTYLDRYRIHSSQRNEGDPEDGPLHVHFEIGLCPEFKSFILGMIPDVKIHEPADLKEELRDRAKEWLSE
jgi:hypothetical protein